MAFLRAAAVLLAVLVAPGTAHAAASIWKQELPVAGARTMAGTRATRPFDLVGLHWQGSGRVLFRTRAVSGHWSVWRQAAPEAEDVPDPGTAEAHARRGWRIGNPYWVGASDRIDYRLVGNVRRLRVWFVRSPVGNRPLRTVAMAGSPQIVSRAGWSADEKIRRSKPRYTNAVSLAVVHHTAGSSSYDPAASAAIVRGIELYHVRANGWNDIGYNFLVDRYGQVFEGRYGGIDRNVIGAHARGFNTGSVGVAVIGNYTSARISPAAERALANLLAWRLDVAHADPLGFTTRISGGNSKYGRGVPVLLRAISGHRDTGFTACPGAALYKQLPAIAKQASTIGQPKLYAPVVRGKPGGIVRFTARLSSSRAWTVTVQNAVGEVVATGSGSGAAVEWTWSSRGVPPGRYRWTIEAGSDTRLARGAIGRAPSVSSLPLPQLPSPPPQPTPSPPKTTLPIVSELTLDPSTFSPDGDGTADEMMISYLLGARAAVTAIVTDQTGATAATLFAAQKQAARRQSFPFDGAGLPDGRYQLTILVTGEAGRPGVLQLPFVIDRTLSHVGLSTSTLSPNGDGTDDTLGISYTLTQAATATVQIEREGAVVATIFSGSQNTGAQSLNWDGNTTAGPAGDGAYEVNVIVQGPLGETRRAVDFSLAWDG